MKYQIIPVTPFQQNCSLIWCDETKAAAVVDPGGDMDRILAEVDKLGVKLEKILLTHGHIDHVGAAKELADHAGIPIIGPHKADSFWLDNLPEQSKHFGFAHSEPFAPTQYLASGDTVTLGSLTLEVLHCPGHTPGHIVFFSATSRTVWVGDVLFHGSIGRTDFPQSNHQDLIDSITKNLWPLGRDVEFVPGHGPISTLGTERDQNPFVADQLFS
ncbi:MBL fold metallo-hydrolase [Shewanella violacea]|uniref:Metallo-beta-lactamase family protein n=1 Tax=Shewanella violacea (strain JCM 10179 / CIP 106290 / LMG 19151 / DSS12) TaxID=637905 RepID=D4ZMA0_SHEVD|nr:MBL fold metallo-hydrolase [Shewanella violacea]BAJ02799.1 metallo-beta-lactamase family protein [Shewanella violacea DSS12]